MTARLTPEELTKLEPSAWLTNCPQGHEFDSIVFPDKEDAFDQAMTFVQTDIDQLVHDPDAEEEADIEARWKPIPLYAVDMPRLLETLRLQAEREKRLREALKPLVEIANAYDKNALDDEARKWYGPDGNEKYNTRPPVKIELYQGRGGKQLLTLADCFAARAALESK